MGRHGKSLRAVVNEITQSSDRSSLFWWLVEHHDEIAEATQGRRLRWSALCVRFEEAGLTDLNGRAASPETARRTWLRVRQMVSEARERQAADADRPQRVGAVPPSRLPAKWKPDFLAQPRGTALPVITRPAQPFPAHTSGASVAQGMQAAAAAQGVLIDPNDPPEVQEKLLKLEAQLRRADRYLGPPMKRRTD